MIRPICAFNARTISKHYRIKHPGRTIPGLPRERKAMSVKKLFGFPVKEAYEVITERDPLVIPGDPDYIFPEKQTQQLLLILRRLRTNHAYIFGLSGTGKTQLVLNTLDKLNWPCARLNGDSFLTRANLVGKMIVKDGETVWQDGILPAAMENGWVLLIDEYDTLNPIASNILKPMLEKFPRLVIPEDTQKGPDGKSVPRVVEAHPDFRVVATANTAGRGDDTGMFINTHTQSVADMRRFSAFIEMEFPSRDDEVKIIRRKFDEIDVVEARLFCDVAVKMREAYKKGAIDRTFSPAEVLNWVETFMELNDAKEAAMLSFLNAYHADSKVAALEMIGQVFGHGS